MAAIPFDSTITSLRTLYQLENVTDDSGNGLTLTNNNTVTFTTGNFSNAANFGATNTNKSLSTTSNVFTGQAPTTWSFGFWVKLLAEPATNTAVAFLEFNTGTTSSDAAGFVTYRDVAGEKQIRLFVTGTSTNSDTAVAVTALGTSVFHQIVVVRTANTSLKLYLDNVVVIDTSVTGSNGLDKTSTDKFMLAKSRNDTIYASVLIDSTFVSESVMSVTAINEFYNGRPSGFFTMF